MILILDNIYFYIIMIIFNFIAKSRSMKLIKVIIENYRAIDSLVEININNFNCIVGKNDVGKSTILKALDLFFNDKNPQMEDKNIRTESLNIEIIVIFKLEGEKITIDEVISTSFEEEDLVDENGFLCVKKCWDMSKKTPKAEWYIKRKFYENDFLLMSEKDLLTLCQKIGIDTHKANGEDYNNVEKRGKIRQKYIEDGKESKFDYTQLTATGKGRDKKILDEVKNMLPTFEYFKADSSLSESDLSIQKYFREKALNILKEEINTDDLESNIRTTIGSSLSIITDKINSVVPVEEQISADVVFDWSKLISTTFQCKKDTSNIPLNSRGDGFRRITMMSYFEMLAEEKKDRKNIIFGFEEPETFLHPEIQKQLFEKLYNMTDNNYQIFVTTHSPVLVASCDRDSIIFVQKSNEHNYVIYQKNEIDVENIVKELGIKPNDEIYNILSPVQLLLLVEGKDDVIAFKHIAQLYKQQHLIEKDFDELKIHLLPIGGCGCIQTWTNLNIIKNLNFPCFIVLDSDKESETCISPNSEKLIELGYKENIDFHVTYKREIENYIPIDYFKNLENPIEITYGDWDDVKKICKEHEFAGRLGGKNVCERHFPNLTFEQIIKTLKIGDKDEFLEIYHNLLRIISN